jgi:hypothetical protein
MSGKLDDLTMTVAAVVLPVLLVVALAVALLNFVLGA